MLILSLVIGRGDNGNEEALSTPTPTPTVMPTASTKPGGVKPLPAVYTQVVEQYVGRRIQFDERCQAIPNNMTFKVGTEIMLDNRSGDARIIKVGTTAYSLSGYGYKIIAPSSTTLPKTLYVSCAAAINVGQILLQN